MCWGLGLIFVFWGCFCAFDDLELIILCLLFPCLSSVSVDAAIHSSTNVNATDHFAFKRVVFIYSSLDSIVCPSSKVRLMHCSVSFVSFLRIFNKSVIIFITIILLAPCLLLCTTKKYVKYCFKKQFFFFFVIAAFLFFQESL